MKTIVKEIITSVITTLLFAVVLCGIYPLIVWGAGQLLFSHHANGSLIESGDRKIVGSEWLGQNFTSAKYFQPRPSGAGYRVNLSSTYLEPISQKLNASVKAAVEQYRKNNCVSDDVAVPEDAVTSSGSGCYPHISVKNALLQAARVAKERGLREDVVKGEIAKATARPSFGIFGDAGVNVLTLNVALDKLTAK